MHTVYRTPVDLFRIFSHFPNQRQGSPIKTCVRIHTCRFRVFRKKERTEDRDAKRRQTNKNERRREIPSTSLSQNCIINILCLRRGLQHGASLLVVSSALAEVSITLLPQIELNMSAD